MDDAMATPTEDSSIGDAVSGRGEHEPHEDEDMYYIPERRRSLELGPSPMDTSTWHFVDLALSPIQSYGSMTSEDSLAIQEDTDGFSTSVKLQRADSFSSCYSFDSDDCEKKILKVKSEDYVQDNSDSLQSLQTPTKIRHPSLTVPFTFKIICHTLKQLSEAELKRFKWLLWSQYPQSFSASPQSMDMVDLVDRLLECYSLEVALDITEKLLVDMEKKREAKYIQIMCIRNEVRYDLREDLKKKYGEVCQDLAMEGQKRPFDDVYANLYISSKCNNGPNIEHEVLTIEKVNTHHKPGKRLLTKDILTAVVSGDVWHRLVWLTGLAGSGKSMIVRKLILDWIEERSHDHIFFMFPLPVEELKQFEGSEVSLVEIIQKLFPATKKLSERDLRFNDDYNAMFILDGLEEYNPALDFTNTMLVSDPEDKNPLRSIVINLLKGKLCFGNFCFVTSRPGIKFCCRYDTNYKHMDLCGFCDLEKEEFFKKRFEDPDQAAQVVEYVKSLKTVHIMCHLPLFCCVVADECQRTFREKGPKAELPRSITHLYTKLLLVLLRQRRASRAPDCSPDKEVEFLMEHGKVALNMLEQGTFKAVRVRGEESVVNEPEAIVNTGLCTQFMTMPRVLCEEILMTFIHPTMQEYLAALYAYLTFRNQGKNIFDQHLKSRMRNLIKGPKAVELYKSAVERSLQCEDGRLDIFLRFLFGMANKTNQELLQPFCTSSTRIPNLIPDAASLLRKKMKDSPHTDRSRNLKYCQEELGA
ncbi:NLR family CARD domain-containing protein 3 [Odontesthes bonariensis]|uniref:NLR family CARD domain-containing protein 3 n=1 Tax=Odontesthes bonariensis TaxID=219752 RepID=UPI003F5834B8